MWMQITYLLQQGSKKKKKDNHQRKEQICLVGQISTTFVVKDSYKKEDVPQKEFLKDCGLMLRANCTNSICGSFLAKMFDSILIPKLNLPSKR
jgi:hypothetical protein